MSQTTTDRILYALFCLSRDTRHIDATELARASGVSTTAAGQALLELERGGLVDASRARLTMLGLARAARLSGASGGQPRVDLRDAKPRGACSATPLAAAPEPSADTDDRLECEIRRADTLVAERCTLQ
jgi:DNA-binding transcriptional ArsR family regulator